MGWCDTIGWDGCEGEISEREGEWCGQDLRTTKEMIKLAEVRIKNKMLITWLVHVMQQKND